MAVFQIAPTDRTFVYPEGDTKSFVQWTVEGDDDAVKIIFVSNWNFTASMSEFDIDRIDSGIPFYTPITDIKGTFSFDVKGAVSLFDTLAVPADKVLLSYIIAEMSAGRPPILIFAPVMYGEEVSGTGNKYVNIVFEGRVTDIPIDQVINQGVHDITISGEITKITQIRREATANELG